MKWISAITACRTPIVIAAYTEALHSEKNGAGQMQATFYYYIRNA